MAGTAMSSRLNMHHVLLLAGGMQRLANEHGLTSEISVTGDPALTVWRADNLGKVNFYLFDPLTLDQAAVDHIVNKAAEDFARPNA